MGKKRGEPGDMRLSQNGFRLQAISDGVRVERCSFCMEARPVWRVAQGRNCCRQCGQQIMLRNPAYFDSELSQEAAAQAKKCREEGLHEVAIASLMGVPLEVVVLAVVR